MAVTLQANNDYNERFAPAGAKKAYVARITGRDSKLTFAREFIGNGDVLVDDAGLYEVRNVDKKGRPNDSYYVVLEHDGEIRRSTVMNREQAMPIAKAMAERTINAIVEFVGRPSRLDPTKIVFDAVLITAKQAEKKAVAQTIDQITDDCWKMLQMIPEKQAKAVLAALKARVSPKVPATVAPLSEETPVGIINDYARDNGATENGVGMTPTPIDQENS
jgi:hypothetical protein